MKREPEVFLRHILDSINYANAFTQQSKSNFLKSVRDQDAVIRRIEIIGEAANKLPSETKKKYPHIPWRDIGDMRNLLIHEYFGVDLDQVWRVVKEDLPLLKKQIKEILGED